MFPAPALTPPPEFFPAPELTAVAADMPPAASGLSPGWTDPAPLATPPLTAEELHKILLKTFCVGNRVRKKFILTLYAVYAGNHYNKLGSPTIAAYAGRHFGYSRSQTYEFLRVAETLKKILACDRAFEGGDICWSALREIVKIARPDTEQTWLSFATTHTGDALKDEVKDALLKKRDKPRKDSYGLPNLPTRMGFELEPHENKIVTEALAKVAHELRQSLNGESVSAKAALLFMAERFLETDPVGCFDEKRTERQDPVFTVSYCRCPTCRRAAVVTERGRFEVPGEVVDRFEREARILTITPEEEGEASPESSAPADAAEDGAEGSDAARAAAAAVEPAAAAADPEAAATEKITDGVVPPDQRDRPNPPWVTEKVRVRDGQMCSNPYCRRRMRLHGHHLKFRCMGGRTIPGNETTICDICHSNCHHGRLFIEGNPIDGITWRTVADGLKLTVDEELRELNGVPEVRVVVAAPAAPAVPAIRKEEEKGGSEGDALPAELPVERQLVWALTNVGYEKRDARRRVTEALGMLSQQTATPSEAEILYQAMRI